MPKLIKRVPKYRRHATGQAMVTLNGKDIYLGEHGSSESRQLYKRRIAEWTANNRALPAKIIGDDFTIAEFVHAFWNYAKVYYKVEEGKSNGEFWALKLALRVMTKLYADTPVVEFGPLALRAVRDAMVKEGWSRKYVNAQVNRLRRAFKWGVGTEQVPANIWHGLQAVEPLREGKTKARETTPVTTVDDALVNDVLPFLNRHIRAMVELQQATGMRPGELVIMRGVDLNTQNPKLWEYRPAYHKNTHRGQERVIYLNTAAQEIVQPFLKADVNAYLFDPREAEAERLAARSAARKTPLSCGNKPGTNKTRKPHRTPGERYDVTSYRRAISRGCINAFPVPDEIKADGKDVAKWRRDHHWHPHQIRHNTATKLRALHGLEAAQVILGHKTLSAAQIYAEKNVAKAKEIMQGGN